MAGLKMKIEWETRLCEVNGELGYFHCWEHYSKPVPASIMAGGPPAGVISRVYGIVEFKDRVGRVEPHHIKFCDEQNAVLNEMNKIQKGE